MDTLRRREEETLLLSRFRSVLTCRRGRGSGRPKRRRKFFVKVRSGSNPMRMAFSAFCFCCATAVAWPQSSALAGSEPSPMEALATGSGVRTIWSNEVGRLRCNGTAVAVTALVIDYGSPARQTARGVRVDLSRLRFWPVYARDHIYLDEEATERTRRALEEIPDVLAGDPRVQWRQCMGAREFWPLYDWPWNKYHELNAQICEDSKGSALVLFGRGRRGTFQFPGGSPTSLAGILASAINQAKQH